MRVRKRRRNEVGGWVGGWVTDCKQEKDESKNSTVRD